MSSASLEAVRLKVNVPVNIPVLSPVSSRVTLIPLGSVSLVTLTQAESASAESRFKSGSVSVIVAVLAMLYSDLSKLKSPVWESIVAESVLYLTVQGEAV